MDIRESEAWASRCYQDVQQVGDFMKSKVNPFFDGINKTSDRDVYIHGLFLRAVAWMLSLNNLNHGKHFQAIISGVRSLLEITTDLILLHYDNTNASAWRMRWWGLSSKLKAAKAVINFYATRAKKAVPYEDEDIVLFVQNEEAVISDMRQKLWPDLSDPNKGRHPERWTDRRTLLQDVQEADRLHGTVIESHLGSNLEEFYETEYRRMNWNVHGSGLTGIRDIPPEGVNVMCGLGYLWGARLSMICIDVVLRDLQESGRGGDVTPLRKETEALFKALFK